MGRERKPIHTHETLCHNAQSVPALTDLLCATHTPAIAFAYTCPCTLSIWAVPAHIDGTHTHTIPGIVLPHLILVSKVPRAELYPLWLVALRALVRAVLQGR